MTRLLAVLAFCLSAPAALADDRVSPSEFETYAEGFTLYFHQFGEAYGVEQFLPGRRTIWAFTGGECMRGTWYEEAGDICFMYDGFPEAQCWSIHRRDGGYAVRFRGNPPEQDLVVVRRTPVPMSCAGPDVGA